MRRKHAEVAELLKHLEPSGRGEEPLHPLADTELGCRQRVPGAKYETHHRASGEIDLAPNAFACELRVHQTRSPRLESMKILRRRKGTGDAVRRCARSFREGSINT